MKKDLIKLIDSRKEIEKMFHPFGGGMGTSFERISDVPEFQNWLQEIMSIPIEISILFGNSEHPFPERKNMPFRSRVQPFI